MRPAERGLGHFHVRENFSHLVELPQVGAEDGVDESGLRNVAGTLGLLDGFVDGGVRRNAIQPENLVEAKAQEIDERGTRGATGRGLARDEAVERGLPADDATNKFVTKSAVSGRKPRGSERRFEEILGEFAAGQPLRQHSGRNLSWILNVQFV